MSDPLGVTTFLTVISTVTTTPQPTTITTVLTVLVQVSGTVTESYAPDPTQTLSLTASEELSSSPGVSAATLNSTATDIVTVSVTLAPSPTSTRLAVSSTPPATPNTESSKPTITIFAVLGPLIAIVAVVTVWRIRRTRHKQPKPPTGQGRSSSQTWFAKISKLWSAENKSADELPWQMPDGGVDEAMDGLPPTAAPAPEPAPPPPRPSPSRTVRVRPSRPSRPTSLSMSIRQVMQTGSSGSSSHITESRCDNNLPAHSSTRGTGEISPQSRADIPMDEYVQAYDGTRRAFYETALNRNLPFDMLARPSLRLERLEETDHDRSLTPDPLRIVKKTDSGSTTNEPSNERQGGMRRAHTEPLSAGAYVPRDMGGSIEQDLIEELNSIDGSTVDDETRRQQREDTLHYLEGVLPISPPASYRASSVYSRNQWGSPILRQEQQPPALPGQDSGTAGGGSKEPEGKGKDVDRSGVGAGKWI